MRILIKATFPLEPFNTLVRNGSVGQKMKRILDELKPEAAYFAEFNGKRTAILVVDLADSSKIPTIAEPFFLTFNADVEFHPTMTPDDLAKSGIEGLGKKWS